MTVNLAQAYGAEKLIWEFATDMVLRGNIGIERDLRDICDTIMSKPEAWDTLAAVAATLGSGLHLDRFRGWLSRRGERHQPDPVHDIALNAYAYYAEPADSPKRDEYEGALRRSLDRGVADPMSGRVLFDLEIAVVESTEASEVFGLIKQREHAVDDYFRSGA